MESIFDEEKKVEGLSNKVAELIRRYTEARDENEKLRTELATIKAQNEALGMQLGTLENDLAYRKMSDEDLSKLIDDILAGDNLGEK